MITTLATSQNWKKKKKKLKRKAHDANPKPRCKLGFNLRSNSRIQFAFKWVHPYWFLRIWTWELPSKVGGPCKYSIAAPNLLILLPFIVRNCRDGAELQRWSSLQIRGWGEWYIRTLALGPGAELDSGQLGITSKRNLLWWHHSRSSYNILLMKRRTMNTSSLLQLSSSRSSSSSTKIEFPWRPEKSTRIMNNSNNPPPPPPPPPLILLLLLLLLQSYKFVS